MPENGEILEINQRSVRRLPDRPQNTLRDGDRKRQVFLVGSKGIPACYGGFETFVEKLTEYRITDKICYHVARLAGDRLRYLYNGAECFDVKTPQIGPARAIWYDVAALRASIRWCRRNPGAEQPIFYVLACRIGPFIGLLHREIESLGGVLYVNPDGHEWKRGKWSLPVRWYWKWSERLMVKHADRIICDSIHIQKYIQEEYRAEPARTCFIAYGAEMERPLPEGTTETYTRWLMENGVSPDGYYLAVSRFVPENNFETMLREFLKSDSKRMLILIATENRRFYRLLEKKLGFSSDRRIKFVKPVYDQGLLRLIRENAYGYLHGHEVGGTNPSLLEALGSTKLNLLLDVGFNREVAEESALYWTKEPGSLAALLQKADGLSNHQRETLGAAAKARIAAAYRWEQIVSQYELLFLEGRCSE